MTLNPIKDEIKAQDAPSTSSEPVSAVASSEEASAKPLPAEPQVRVRVWFAKERDQRFLSHHDVLRTWERWLRRANVRLAKTQGFRPRPKLLFPSALAVGIWGEREILELVLEGESSAEKLFERLTCSAPPGLVVKQVESLPTACRGAKVIAGRYEIQLPTEAIASARSRIDTFLQTESWPIVRPPKQIRFDIRPGVKELLIDGNTLKMRLEIRQEGSVRPREVFQALGLESIESTGAVLHRVAVELAGEALGTVQNDSQWADWETALDDEVLDPERE